jgi:hypothetical protein
MTPSTTRERETNVGVGIFHTVIKNKDDYTMELARFDLQSSYNLSIGVLFTASCDY